MPNEFAIRTNRLSSIDHLLGIIVGDLRKNPIPTPKWGNSLAQQHAAERVIDCSRDPTPAD